ncbi:MAG: AAA family ATPase [Candidatus Acidifodinimicrobium sp.]
MASDETVGLARPKMQGCEYNLWEKDPMTKQAPRITPKNLETKLDTIFSNLDKLSGDNASEFTRALPLFIFGPPGIGKSQIVESLGKKYTMNVETYIASTMDPTQVQGLPFPNVKNKTTQWYPDERFVDQKKNTKVYFFDELNMAPPATQAAFYRLILEGRLGSIDISHALRIGAGNRISDYYNVQQMGLPMATRFEVYVMQPDIDDWIAWAKNKKLNQYVIKYAEYVANTEPTGGNRYAPDRWYCINPNEPSLARATPRSWERVSQLLNIGLNTKEDFIGSLGVYPGEAFETWYRKEIAEEKGIKGKIEYEGGRF